MTVVPYERDRSRTGERMVGEGRVPPSSLEAERSVLGGVLLENSALNVLLEILDDEDFYSEANAQIFRSMKDLFGRGAPIDAITLRDEVTARGKLQSVGGDEYLLQLTDVLPSVANIESHAKIVREKAIVRRLILAGHEVAARGYGDYGDFEQYLDQSEKAIFEVAKTRVRNPHEHIKQIIIRTFQQIQLASQNGERITGLPSGFDRLDMMTAGMHPGDLIIVAGRPGMGKTSFALNVGVNAVVARKRPLAIFSLEMPKDQIVARMLTSEARVDAQRMRTGRLGRDDWPALASAAGVLSDLPIIVDDTAGLTIMELRAKARRIRAEVGDVGLIIVDYLQLMRAGVRTDNREQEISEISRSLKGLAKELSIPVIALSQLNRGVESRAAKDKRPQLSDLRESGAIEQDADTIMFIYREEVYNRETTEQGVAEIIVGKQRHGPTGTIRCRFFNQYTRFDNLADDEYGPSDEPGY